MTIGSNEVGSSHRSAPALWPAAMRPATMGFAWHRPQGREAQRSHLAPPRPAFAGENTHTFEIFHESIVYNGRSKHSISLARKSRPITALECRRSSTIRATDIVRDEKARRFESFKRHLKPTTRTPLISSIKADGVALDLSCDALLGLRVARYITDNYGL